MKLRINLGSGQRPFAKPWINVDIQAKWSPDVVADGAHMPMFKTGSTDIIVLHHVLEHAGCGEAAAMLLECQRVLRPGGSLLVFVPDMWALAHAWLEGKIADQIYFTSVYGAFMNNEADRHRWGYTRTTLQTMLDALGFKTIRFDWRRLDGADLARDFWILGVEAIR